MRRTKVATAAAAFRADISDLIGLVVLGTSFVVLYLSAWLAWWPVFVVALVIGVAVDLRGERHTRRIFEVFELSRLGTVERQVARDAALLLLLWRADRLPAATIAALGLGLVLCYAILAAFLLARQYVERIRTLPIETRNVALDALSIPDAPRPGFLLANRWLTAPWAVSALGLLLADLTASRAIGFAGIAVAALAGVAALAVMLTAFVGARHLRHRAAVFRTTLSQLGQLRPEVVLYHSGAPGSAYQVNMWLSTLEQLGRPAMVLLRQSEHLAELEPTFVPIACVPSASDVMDFELPSLRLALYVGNVGENIHLIRNGSLKHVFIGHGDSDKAASANRVSRVYDEVWVAGPAGRARYRNSDAGVTDDALVEVGRPQLRGVRPARSRGDDRLTILYAPTWEGWSDDMNLASVDTMGVALVDHLLADPAVRVIYRPHPLAGTRSPAIRQAHQSIVKLLNDRAAVEDGRAPQPVRPRSSRSADAAERARDGRLDAAAVAAIAAARANREDQFWRAHEGRHAVLTPAGPSLYSCFNHADVLITDVSSVISDFIASAKPYLVTNPAGLADDAFLAQFPAAAGGYLLRPNDGALPAILATLREPGPDPLAARRAQAREQLLGPAEPDAMSRFAAAADALFAPSGPRPAVAIPAPTSWASSPAPLQRR